MKTFVATFLFVVAGFVVRAQQFSTAPDVLAQFPDGNTHLFQFINDQMSYSNRDMERKIEGEMIVTFTVETDGHLSDIEVKKGLSSDINTKVVDVIQKMPRWRPGSTNGEQVNSRYTLAMVIQAHNRVARPLF